MVLGDDEAVDEGAIEDFRRSGLLHILAVSGENVVLLCSMWSFALLLLGVPRTARLVVLLPIIAAYVVVTGASPSIMRAGVAGCITCLAALVSRPSDGWLLWLMPAAALLTLNPYTLLDVSFQLSFAAVAGLLLLSRPLHRGLALPARPARRAGRRDLGCQPRDGSGVAGRRSARPRSSPCRPTSPAASRLGPIMFLGMISCRRGPARAPALGPRQPAERTLHRLPAAGGGVVRRPVVRRLRVARSDAAVMLLAGAAGEALVLQRLARRAGLSLRAFVGGSCAAGAAG